MEQVEANPTVAQLFDLRGKVALLTGATGHLGSAMASALAEAGASVVATSRDLAAAQASAGRLVVSSDKQRHSGVELDHTSEASIASAFEQAVSSHGRVDVLINNAHDRLGDDWKTVTAEQFTRQLANTTAYFLLARKLRDHAVSRRSTASVVMLASMYGVVGSYPDVYDGICTASPVAYHALKGGIVQMTRHLAVYWAKDGVRVNALSPGPFPTPKADPQLIERLNAKVPMGRIGEPHELKGAVVFLASEASSYMTGQNLVIDGGWTAW